MSRTHIPAELRRAVRLRAHDCCEYCLIPESMTLAAHEIDHIIAEKHGGPTDADNLALACALCNGFKGSDLASIDAASGDIVPLFNPRRDGDGARRAKRTAEVHYVTIASPPKKVPGSARADAPLLE